MVKYLCLIFHRALNCYLWRWSLPPGARCVMSCSEGVYVTCPMTKLRSSQWQDVWLKLSRIKGGNNQKILRTILGVSQRAEFRLSTSKDHRRVIPCEIEDVDTQRLKVIWIDYIIAVFWERLTSLWGSYLFLISTDGEFDRIYGRFDDSSCIRPNK